MIPAFNASGVLPPYLGATSAVGGLSPYPATMTEVVRSLGTTPERLRLLRGLLGLRRDLAGVGVKYGIQWLNGSFCEDCERLRGRPPGDIDLVTIFVRPQAAQDYASLLQLMMANLHLFNRARAKAEYGCDSFYVDAGQPPVNMLRQATYWLGLFTHQRDSHLWKGILQVPLTSDDADADTLLTELEKIHEKA